MQMALTHGAITQTLQPVSILPLSIQPLLQVSSLGREAAVCLNKGLHQQASISSSQQRTAEIYKEPSAAPKNEATLSPGG